MSRINLLRRVSIVGGAAATAVALSAGAASAHHCFVPMYHFNGPQAHVWFVATAADGALELAGFTAGCEGAEAAGYDALEAAGLPVALKIKVSKTIGDPKEEGRVNPNGDDGHGLEYLEESPLIPAIVGTYIEAASSYDCGA